MKCWCGCRISSEFLRLYKHQVTITMIIDLRRAQVDCHSAVQKANTTACTADRTWCSDELTENFETSLRDRARTGEQMDEGGKALRDLSGYCIVKAGCWVSRSYYRLLWRHSTGKMWTWIHWFADCITIQIMWNNCNVDKKLFAILTPMVVAWV